ncbi:BirA family transcriptional regulator, biotin operon repressor / biotin-[acetyl-CoA-carboxylase] ligase [Rhodoblastus acidophilus]|uniref:biotin--[biotin carboxyl-carrier protein] ligase n=1 Tax=Rhodoblastus acidophilus TaxID=1074 RepID=A0A212QEL2_RHOAC|nr:biotin--[acetyl-CoA-carboxylase] ligase [Rhodoblastus acidophilus]PPQ40027.1 biotin--[acetyl-CoA-carboxylase] ligase [Rhodoblastus acidophilus]RAI22330.1 biotin--[acetyl-CoA-carboxylase] ligase [Rhodoblastus acidophilus]SNB57840.1 BirA family transcriptional regulator, biotin operon repressor / biotin-[acetyl-CoA-carboxylase] ligase [Rhodoblastus acidophilus]
MELGVGAARSGYRLEHFEDLGSTNDEAAARVASGDPGRLWIVADRQSRGRGRLGRVWTSSTGNLFASLMLIEPCARPAAPQLGFVAGVALADCLRNLLGGDRRLALKWPNDALYDGAKLSGLLLESLGAKTFGCVIGFGVNCVSHPDDTPYPATSLRAIGAAVSRAAVFAALSDSLAQWLDVWARGDNFATIRRAWLDVAGGLDAPARVQRNGNVMEGTFRGIDAHGRMLLESHDGKMDTIEAGDLSFAAPLVVR